MIDKFDIVAENYVDDYKELAKEIYKAGLKRGRSKAKKITWIPCSERLPDKGLRVLMQLNNAWQVVGWYDKEDKQWFEVMYAEPVANDRVLAWMPLPESYKAESEENK